ncbi:FIST signal transduction protein [Bradyrhizobium stylosanthis]|uniref:FIST signal transduction protein n=1 Tax=Bradyrhizobium stylosanthis TaxID=1803665 RepID=UPI0007C45506|nr:FIST N-terminal domain-containing protein [Bradyrhizobium stylosanthis]
MHIQYLHWNAAHGWRGADALREPAQLVLYFGGREALADGARYRELRGLHPESHIVGCSTGGQIHGDDIADDVIVAVALHFARTQVRVVNETIESRTASRACGVRFARQLAAPDLAGVFVLSDGLNANGNELIAGISDVLGPDVLVTGGLAGDGTKLEQTLVGADGEALPNRIAAIGFYGASFRFAHGCAGGWDVFGPRRKVTKSDGPVVVELDGEPPLDLYTRYLGEEEAAAMPGSGLAFPLRIHDEAAPDRQIVRSVFAVDRNARTLTFAADIPQGCTAQLMRANFDSLAAGAGEAGRQARTALPDAVEGDKLAILVSCTGRRRVMGQRTQDELDAVAAELGDDVVRIGFYSYGEIAPPVASGRCELHNQTMTVTMIAEAAA